MSHRDTPEATYRPVKIRTLLLWFVALCVGLAFGLQVGSSFSVDTPDPSYTPFPVSKETDEPLESFPPAVVSTPEVAEIVPQAAPKVISVSVPVVSAPKPRTYVEKTVSAPSSEPVVVVEEVPVVSPDPASGDEKDTPEQNCIQQSLEWDGIQCVQPQLPEETICRQIDGPNGELYVIIDVEGNTAPYVGSICEISE